MTSRTDTPLLRASGIRKSFQQTQALDGVGFDVRAGEIHALLGENGAGKSTLVRIMSGVLAPDSGSLELDGRPIELSSPGDAFAHGIVVVHQELSLMPNLTVAENVCLERPPLRRGLGRLVKTVDRAEMRRQARAALDQLGAKIDPRMRVELLGPAQRQLVEIARALLHSARVILLDEPTSSLPPNGRRELFSRLKDLRAQGIGIVFITHLLEEALELSDRITVLRDGRHVGTCDAHTTSVADLVELMTGRPAGSVFPQREPEEVGAAPRLQVERLSSHPELVDVSFTVRAGEIVGLAGLVGSGRTETLKTIFGARSRTGGRVLVDGVETDIRSPRAAIRRGIAFIPENRQDEGVFADHSVIANVSIAAANTGRGERLTRLWGLLVDRRRSADVAARLTDVLKIRTPSVRSPVSGLSGGNQQKVVVARWLAVRPSVVLADEPTRGVSIGSKIEIYRLLRELANQGEAIVLVSSEFEELVGLCQRIVLMRAGKSVGEVRTEGLDADSLLHLVLLEAA